MDIDYARGKLTDFITLCQRYDTAMKGTRYQYHEPTMKPILDAIYDALPTVEQIIGHLDTKLLTDDFGEEGMTGWDHSSRQARKALAVLRDHEERKSKLAPDAHHWRLTSFIRRSGAPRPQSGTPASTRSPPSKRATPCQRGSSREWAPL
jgi:hypothetical protein